MAASMFQRHSLPGWSDLLTQGGQNGYEIGVPRVGSWTQATGLDRLVKAFKHVVRLRMFPDSGTTIGFVMNEIDGGFPDDGSGGDAVSDRDSPVAHKKHSIHGEFQFTDVKRAGPRINDGVAADWQAHDVGQPGLLPSVGHRGLALVQGGSLG